MGDDHRRRAAASQQPRTFGVPGTGLRRPCRRPDGSGPGLGRGPAAKRDRGLPSRGRADAPLQHRVKAILALDQGTTGSSAIVFDTHGSARGIADREIRQFYPASGHVEHDPEEIFATTVAVGREALRASGVGGRDLAAIGITNQRETTIVWERDTGRPIHPAVVWQSRASAAICERLRADGHDKLVRERTGLVIDAYFSGTKIRWILDQVPGAQRRADAGELVCGTIDTWLMWNLTGGRTHATDVSNASRTLVFDIHRRRWDDDLLGLLGIPRSMMAAPVPSSGVVGETDARHFGAAVPIAGIAGDQQAAR